MRVLIVSHYFDTHRGGIEIVAAQLAEALAGAGHQVLWAATDATPPAAMAFAEPVVLAAWNIAERRLGLPLPLLLPAGFAALARAVAAVDIVLVHDGLYTTSLAALNAARRADKPAMVVQHIGAIPYRNRLLDEAMRLANRFVVAPALARADQAIFISHAVRAHFAATRFARPPEVIFNGVAPWFRAPASAERARLRAEFGLGTRRTALFVGRFVEKKGLRHIRAAAMQDPDTLFLLAGWGVIDPAAWELANVRVIAGLAGETLARLYRAADMLVLPSVGEGLPLVIQEALASGLPVICNEETAAADLAMAPWVRTICVTPDAVATGARLAVAIAAMPPADADRVARARFARERYDWTGTAARYAALMTTVVAPGSNSALQPLTELAA